MNEAKMFGLGVPPQETPKVITEQRKQEVNRSVLNNQLKYNLGADMASYFEAQGFVAKESGYSKPDDATVIAEPNYGDNALSYRVVYENIAGSKINTESNLVDNIAYVDATGQTIKQIIDGIKANQEYWQDDNDSRVIVHRISATRFAIAKRVPKYVENASQEAKQFEIFVSLVENENKTFSDSRTLEQIREEEIAALSETFQTPIDYVETQEGYKNAIQEDKEMFEKHY